MSVLYESFAEEWELENCQFCPDKDVCALQPEEYEDECHFVRSSSDSTPKAKKEMEK